MTRLVGLAAGFAFGALLTLARMNEYDAIHQMLLLRSAEFYLVFAAAAPVAMAGLWLLRRRGWRTPFGGPIALNRYPVGRKDILGAAVFGVGWALVGACPGTALVMLGGGGLSAAIVVAGIFCGIVLHDVASARRAAAPHPLTDSAPAR